MSTTMKPPQKTVAEAPAPKKKRPWLVDFYSTAVGKKYVMAITGMMLMGFVFAHMVGNLKMYLGPEEYNAYAAFLRHLLVPILPPEVALWLMRLGLLTALVFHLASAIGLTVMNKRARPVNYQSKRDYLAANFASRTMRWTGIIILLYLIYHIADLTLGVANPSFQEGNVYGNVVASFSVPVVAAVYVVANLALGVHLYHGGWSLFQSMGWNNPRFNNWRRYFAIGFALLITVANCSFPIAVQLGIVHN